MYAIRASYLLCSQDFFSQSEGLPIASLFVPVSITVAVLIFMPRKGMHIHIYIYQIKLDMRKT